MTVNVIKPGGVVLMSADLIDRHTGAIDQSTTRIEETSRPFKGFATQLHHPRVSILTADVIITETGADMTLFPTLTALLRTIDLGADARKALSRSQIKLIAGWRSRADNAVLRACR